MDSSSGTNLLLRLARTDWLLILVKDLEFVITNKVTHIINCAGKQIPNHWEPIGVFYLTYGWFENDKQVEPLEGVIVVVIVVDNLRCEGSRAEEDV